MAKEVSKQEILEAIITGFNEMRKRFDGEQKQFDGVEKRFDGVDRQLKKLRQGQENLKLKMSNVAYRFELQELQQRVKNLEDKLGK